MNKLKMKLLVFIYIILDKYNIYSRMIEDKVIICFKTCFEEELYKRFKINSEKYMCWLYTFPSIIAIDTKRNEIFTYNILESLKYKDLKEYSKVVLNDIDIKIREKEWRKRVVSSLLGRQENEY